MATALVRKAPQCPLCCENFKIPKVVPCGHTYCLECVEMNIREESNTFLCPICGHVSEVPEGGAAMFTTNLALIKPTEPKKVSAQPLSTEEHKCANHSERKMDFYCTTCRVGICSKCAVAHHKDHQTFDLECEETRKRVVADFQRSRSVVENKIRELENLQLMLSQTSEKLQTMCDEACAEVEERTENAIAEIRARHNLKRHRKPFGR